MSFECPINSLRVWFLQTGRQLCPAWSRITSLSSRWAILWKKTLLTNTHTVYSDACGISTCLLLTFNLSIWQTVLRKILVTLNLRNQRPQALSADIQHRRKRFHPTWTADSQTQCKWRPIPQHCKQTRVLFPLPAPKHKSSSKLNQIQSLLYLINFWQATMFTSFGWTSSDRKNTQPNTRLSIPIHATG